MRLLIISLIAASAFGQGGSITGRVLDIDGQTVADAPIQATNTATRAIYKTRSSPVGAYTLAALPAGMYDLTADVPGFNLFTRKSVNVEGAQNVRLDIHLLDFQLNTLGDGREFKIDQITPHATPSGPAPRTRQGKPDFTGVWYAQRTIDPG